MPESPLILAASPDAALRSALAELLARDGFRVVEAHSTQEAGAAEGLAAAILDAPCASAQERLRAAGFDGPVLLLAEPGSGAGALEKPLRYAALSAHLAGALAAARPLAIGDALFHPAAKIVESPRGRRRLTEKEAAILAFLHRRAPLPASREILLREVWGYNGRVATRTLETHIHRLRKKIDAQLVSEDGGYRLAL
ncbi:MAG: response regulator transcription factor [Hyphomicrobiales bacterium]|nr:response regulator transcription factor [Hyphomicrobiales bacterium]